MENQFALRLFSQLTPDQATGAKAWSVFLFEQPEQVARYFKDGEGFDFARHIFALEEAERRLQNAL